ncbi:thermonuclease family protein [Bradyrhizobium sp. Leo121]|uniref:thermonuclease family protein n=1 Tax=Bradyrhizobium sp. Leo121 TaxID=1571195 RepID=UPI00102A7078|nr:thermonuclease family protein [Bradyrhizobium sp. Leo121]RZN33875.1 nuclease [Bradyrhizobium sp. Leo121]
MPAGLLEVDGTIELKQFWPSGQSDADTTKVILSVGPDAIKFRKDSSSPFHPTHVFNNAKVKGKFSTPPIKNGKVTIRLQGIDATELHYQPSALSAKEKNGLSATKLTAYKGLIHFYRQLLGATSAKALHDFLTSTGKTVLDCRVVTQVDTPNEVFDTYGRLVGDIEVTVNGQAVNLNHWLVEHGWAYPTFYSSMTNDEINALLALAKIARSKKTLVWNFLSNTISPFDFNLREPKVGDLSVLATDKGPAIFPKLYRRYTNWSARKKAQVTGQNFQAFLAAGSGGTPDICFVLADFLATGVHSAIPHNFADFVVGGKTTKFAPDSLVFKEAPSTLLGPDNKPITHF